MSDYMLMHMCKNILHYKNLLAIMHMCMICITKTYICRILKVIFVNSCTSAWKKNLQFKKFSTFLIFQLSTLEFRIYWNILEHPKIL